MAVAVGAGAVWRILERFWRSLATVFCFAVFAVGSLGLALPLAFLALTLGEGARRRRIGKRLVQLGFRLFVGLMRVSGVLRLRVDPALRLRLRQGGLFVVANHPTLIDFVVLGSLCPVADCLVKSELLRDPARRWPVLLAGYLCNDNAEEILRLAERSFAEGNSLFVFPEGTRTVPGEQPHLQKGAAQVAVRLQRDILPLVIHSTPSNLHKGAPFWLAPPERVVLTVRALPLLPVRPFLDARPGEPALAARDLTQHLQNLYNREL